DGPRSRVWRHVQARRARLRRRRPVDPRNDDRLAIARQQRAVEVAPRLRVQLSLAAMPADKRRARDNRRAAELKTPRRRRKVSIRGPSVRRERGPRPMRGNPGRVRVLPTRTRVVSQLSGGALDSAWSLGGFLFI